LFSRNGGSDSFKIQNSKFRIRLPKILRIINRFNIGGPTYNVAYLSKYLAPEFETLLVGGEKDESEDSSEFILDKLGLKPVIIPEMKREINFSNDRAAYKKIKALIREFKPDIVHTHAAKAGALGRLAADACDVPVILHTFHGHVFHSYFGKAKTTVFKSVERYLAKKSDAIIAISEKQKQELALEHKICPAEKIKIIPLGFDLSRFRENTNEKRIAFRSEYHLDENEIAIVIVGRLVPVKNHELFLRGLKAALEKTKLPVRAFIVGDGEDRNKLETLATTLGFDFATEKKKEKKTLTFTSWIKEVDRVLAGSDIVCLTSWNEGTPVSLIEAQAAGRAIVTTQVGGVENVVVPGKTALLCAPGDTEKFTEHLLELIHDAEKRQAFGDAGWPVVSERFHYTRLVADMAEFYRSLLRRK
jgi:glycosyltransferase involved in cell wall biosynthesis